MTGSIDGYAKYKNNPRGVPPRWWRCTTEGGHRCTGGGKCRDVGDRKRDVLVGVVYKQGKRFTGKVGGGQGLKRCLSLSYPSVYPLLNHPQTNSDKQLSLQPLVTRASECKVWLCLHIESWNIRVGWNLCVFKYKPPMVFPIYGRGNTLKINFINFTCLFRWCGKFY